MRDVVSIDDCVLSAAGLFFPDGYGYMAPDSFGGANQIVF
jgi:hypothetical protein